MRLSKSSACAKLLAGSADLLIWNDLSNVLGYLRVVSDSGHATAVTAAGGYEGENPVFSVTLPEVSGVIVAAWLGSSPHRRYGVSAATTGMSQ